MDLAKIRKKSLQTFDKPCDESSTIPASLNELINTLVPIPVDITRPAVNSSQGQSFPQTATNTTETSFTAPVAVEHTVNVRTPLELILSGRQAAGCADESVLADDDSSEVVAETRLEFLCIRVSDEIYGINIMDIKEIIKPREVTEVPRAPVFVSGVLSLRGTIIPVINMCIRLGLNCEEPAGKERIVVIKNSNSLCGLFVSEVTQVVQIQCNAIETAPAVLDGIDRDFISGLCRSDDQMIIILNLANIADINLC